MRALVLASLVLGCSPDEPPAAPAIRLRRLSVHEYDATLRDVLHDATRPGRALLPDDRLRPFDNDWTTQDPSLVLVEAAELLAREVADRLVRDPERLAAVVPCTPVAPEDRACLDQTILTLGRRLLRRPVAPDHAERLSELAQGFVADEGTFEAGVEVVLRALLQDPAFLYRIEVGRPVPDRPGVRELDGYELATRLSYFLWASAPDDALLDAAAAGSLDTAAGIRNEARRMLDDPRARDQVDRFHALWLGYHQLPHSEWLTTAMREETRALVERVVFDDIRPWLDLWTFSESWLEPALAEHYGVAGPGGTAPAWVDTEPDRRGLFGTGSMLSAGATSADTSPTRRGKLVRERVLCDPVQPPPPGVNADNPPPTDLAECKEDRYAQHRNDASCRACHIEMDPIGFGLERYDRAGVFRTHDDGAEQCTITGAGEVVPWGAFSGPAELGSLVVQAEVDACAVEHVLHFALGHAPTTADEALHARLVTSFRAPGESGVSHRFDELLLELVSDPSFRLLGQEPGPVP